MCVFVCKRETENEERISDGSSDVCSPDLARPGRPLLIDPEISTDYEIGIKTSVADRRGTCNVDLYWNDIKDYQAGQIDPDRLALGTYLGNAGSVRMRGVEFDAAYRIDRHFNLSLSGAYNDAIYKSYANAPAPIEYGSGILDLSGQRTGAPKWSGDRKSTR